MDPIKFLLGSLDRCTALQAKIETQNKKTVWINARSFNPKYKNPFLFSDVNSETEIIIFEDVKTDFLLSLIEFLYSETITVNKKGEYPFEIKRPSIIITCEYDGNFFMPESMKRRVSAYKIHPLKPVLIHV